LLLIDLTMVVVIRALLQFLRTSHDRDHTKAMEITHKRGRSHKSEGDESGSLQAGNIPKSGRHRENSFTTYIPTWRARRGPSQMVGTFR